MADSEQLPDDIHVAIIGAGITGVMLALGLQARNVSFAMYERAPGFREIGAGIGFSPNAERAMGLLSPDVFAAYRRVANPNGEDYFQWVDGHGSDELIFRLHVGKDGFQGCRRSDILEEWAKQLPPSAVHFHKEIDTISESSSSDKLCLRFKDGSTTFADVVIGCDGIRSRVRQLVLQQPNPFSTSPPPSSTAPTTSSFSATYTHKFCFRALAPMPAALAALGTARSTTRFMYNGPGAHLITYPVANTTLLNILAVLSDPDPWPHPTQHTCSGTRAESEAFFRDWHPTVRSIVGLLPEKLDKWAIFDMAERPAPGYVSGRVGLAGDAAHAAGPHLGAGGGMGVEDALVLSELLAEVKRRLGSTSSSSGGGEGRRDGGSGGGDGGGAVATSAASEKRKRLLEKSLEVYNEVRYHRTQEVVRSTRQAVDLFQWRDPSVAGDPERFGREITPLFHLVWNYDVARMVLLALDMLGDRVTKL